MFFGVGFFLLIFFEVYLHGEAEGGLESETGEGEGDEDAGDAPAVVVDGESKGGDEGDEGDTDQPSVAESCFCILVFEWMGSAVGGSWHLRCGGGTDDGLEAILIDQALIGAVEFHPGEEEAEEGGDERAESDDSAGVIGGGEFRGSDAGHSWGGIWGGERMGADG